MAEIDVQSFASAFANCFAKDASRSSTRGMLDLVAQQARKKGMSVRASVRNIIEADLQRELKKRGSRPVFFPCTRDLIRNYLRTEAAGNIYGLGVDWGAIIGGAIAAAGTVYANKLKSEGEEKLLKLQLAEQQAATAAAAEQAKAVIAAAAIKKQQAAQAGPGIPTWVWVGAGALLLGGGIYMMTRRKKNPPTKKNPGWTIPALAVGAAVIYGIVKASKADGLLIEILPTPEPTEEDIEKLRGMTLLARVKDPKVLSRTTEALSAANLDYYVEESSLGTLLFIGQENASAAARMLRQERRLF